MGAANITEKFSWLVKLLFKSGMMNYSRKENRQTMGPNSKPRFQAFFLAAVTTASFPLRLFDVNNKTASFSLRPIDVNSLSLSLSLSLSACMCRGEAVTETIQFSNFAEIKLEGPKQIDTLARRALPASASFQISLSCLFPTKWHTCTQQQDRMNQLTNYKCILWLTR